jgi:hypothetical protein
MSADVNRCTCLRWNTELHNHLSKDLTFVPHGLRHSDAGYCWRGYRGHACELLPA